MTFDDVAKKTKFSSTTTQYKNLAKVWLGRSEIRYGFRDKSIPSPRDALGVGESFVGDFILESVVLLVADDHDSHSPYFWTIFKAHCVVI